MPQIYTLPLADPQATIETVGGKGASLARLAASGLPVPDGFHITTAAYRQFVAGHGLQWLILAAVSMATPDQPETLEEACRRIGALFAERLMPEDIAEAIRRAYAGLGNDPAAAVRSSATAEDLPEASFAGQQETYLNIHGEEAVLEAVKRCWASLWTARAIDYRLRHGIAHQDVSLAVVVQKLVDAEAAGVMFTANPVSGERDEIVINAAWGLGEAVVGGQVTPDTILVEKISRKVIEQHIHRKDVMTVRIAGGTRDAPVPSSRRDRAALSQAQASKLARLGLRIEDLCGQPMDIEWALDRGHFFILQARPITTLPGHNSAIGERNDSLTGDYLWTTANYGEAVPDVMTPCTWSLVQNLLDDADPSAGPIRQYGNIGGRLYANLSAPASLAATFGLGPTRFASLIEDGFGRLPEGVEIPTFRLSRLRLLREAVPLLTGRLFRMRGNLRRLSAFLRSAPERCEAFREKIQAASSPQKLVQLWDGEIAPFMHEAFHMLEAAANQGGAAILFTRRNLQKLVGEADADTLLTGPSGEWGHLASLGPLIGLARLARGETSREAYARQYGHRGPHEVEVSTPRPVEDPDWIDKQLAGMREANEDASALLARREDARQAAWQRLRERFPRKEAAIRRQIGRWSAVAHEREAARSEAIRAFWVLRSFVQRAGALTGRGESVFFLSIDEILLLLRGDQTSISSIPARRAAYERYCALPPYPALIRGRFDPFQWATDPQRRSDLSDARGGNRLPAGDAITGFPGAPGIVEGCVRVIPTAEDGSQLQAGEVLVTTVTNVGWTPLFPRAAAVVTDVGAPLSHAAIVARELGIPAVVGCGDATMRLHTGDQVRVDGGQGTVEILQAGR